MKLYIHIPFCISKCAYCDFYSTPRQEWMEAYVEALRSEWCERSAGFDEPIDTLYLGGGTPSSLPRELLSWLLAIFPLDREQLREATIEVNPEDVDSGFVEFLVSQTPIRRVSMGVQSFADSELSIVGRRHDAKRAVEAFTTLRRGGIENISCDLIYGLPGQSLDSWRESLSTLLSLGPEHISAYLLSYEPGTRLSAMLQAGRLAETDDDTLLSMYGHLCDATRQAGYNHYEISNFALPGREAIHNSSYWDGSDYLGLGPAAHSLLKGVRFYNPSSLKDYIASGGRGFAVKEEETPLNRYNELLITRLRTLRGLDPREISLGFGPKIMERFEAGSERLLSLGKLLKTPTGSIIIPEDLWLESNSILLDLIEV